MFLFLLFFLFLSILVDLLAVRERTLRYMWCIRNVANRLERYPNCLVVHMDESHFFGLDNAFKSYSILGTESMVFIVLLFSGHKVAVQELDIWWNEEDFPLVNNKSVKSHSVKGKWFLLRFFFSVKFVCCIFTKNGCFCFISSISEILSRLIFGNHWGLAYVKWYYWY